MISRRLCFDGFSLLVSDLPTARVSSLEDIASRMCGTERIALQTFVPDSADAIGAVREVLELVNAVNKHAREHF